MSVYICLAAAILGLVVYGFSANPKASEVGRILYAVGLFVFLFRVIGMSVTSLFR
jgi:hypothetical protein